MSTMNDSAQTKMLSAGSDIPDVTVWTDPGKSLNLRETAAEGPYALFFYLVDWSST